MIRKYLQRGRRMGILSSNQNQPMLVLVCLKLSIVFLLSLKFWKPQGPYTNKAQMIFSQEYPKVSAQNHASCPIIQVLSAYIPANSGRPGTLKQLQWPKKPLSAMGGRLGPPVAAGCGNWNVVTMAGSLAHDVCLYKNLYDLVWLVCTYRFIYIYMICISIYIYVCVVYGINMHWHAMFSLFPSLSHSDMYIHT